MAISIYKDKEAQVKFVGPVGEYSSRFQYATIDECYNYCKDKMELAEDIETSPLYKLKTYKNEDIYKPGLDPYLSRIVMLQLGDKDCVYVIDTRNVDITPLLPLWKDKERVWVTVNGKFEAKHLLHNYGIIHHKMYDCMLVDQVLTNGLDLGYSMEKMVGRYLNIHPPIAKNLFTPDDENEEDVEYIDKSTRMGFLTIGDMLFTETQILYGANDITHPFRIKELQQEGYKGYNPVQTIALENEFCLVLADIELKGITFSKEKWLANYEKNLVIYNNRKQKLDTWIETNHRSFCHLPDMFEDRRGCKIEWSSSKQVVELFKYLKFCPKEKSKQTGKIEDTVGAKALIKLLTTPYKEKYAKDKETDIVTQEDLILNYLLLKKSEQATTTFGKEFLKYVHPITGKLHSSYRQILHTGRISSNKPNLQNIPADKGYRSCFIAAENNALINVDYSSQESRVVADIANEPTMISFFNNGHPIHGEDMHSFVATKMFSLMRNEPDLICNKETHPEERQTAKSIGFKIIYGGSSYTLQYDFGVTEEVAQEFIDSYLGAFPALKAFFQKSREAAVKNGYIDIRPDRRYWDKHYNRMNQIIEDVWTYYPEGYKKLPEKEKAKVKAQIKKEYPIVAKMWSEYFSLKGSIERNSQNYPVQGCSGSQTKYAAVLFRRHCIKHKLRDKLYISNTIHDEMLVESIEKFANEAVKITVKTMEEGANHYCKKVIMKASGGKCQYWGH